MLQHLTLAQRKREQLLFRLIKSQGAQQRSVPRTACAGADRYGTTGAQPNSCFQKPCASTIYKTLPHTFPYTAHTITIFITVLWLMQQTPSNTCKWASNLISRIDAELELHICHFKLWVYLDTAFSWLCCILGLGQLYLLVVAWKCLVQNNWLNASCLLSSWQSMCPSGFTTSYDHQATSHDTTNILTYTQTVFVKWWQLLGHSGFAYLSLLFFQVSISLGL